MLGSDPEWLIGIGRLITALFAVVAIYLDPTQPAVFMREAKVTLALYVIFALLMVLFPLRRPLDSTVHIAVHSVDVLVLGWLAFLTNELTSPFFSFLPFILLATTMRWGLRGAIAGAAVLETLLIVIGLPDLDDGESELNVLIMRSSYFIVAAVMLGYFGAYRERSRQRLARLADWPFDAVAGDRQHWLGHLFQHAADVLGDPRLLVLWRDQDDPTGSIAYWSNGELKLIDISGETFWSRYDPEQRHQPGRNTTGTAQTAEVIAILNSQPELAAESGKPMRYACSATFSSIQYRGRVFVIDPACHPDESLSLTGIIATRMASELERLALMQQTAETARSQERVRLARDMHDSILQDLTAASLKLKMITGTVSGEAKSQLADVNSLVFDQQRRIRKFVEDQRSPAKTAETELSVALNQCALLLRRQWDCRIDLVLDPPDVEVPNRMSHELSQIISEATANAVRHGGATLVRVRLAQKATGLKLEITDNGSGILNAQETKRPLSLTARVTELGGTLSVNRLAPGFSLLITLPLAMELS
ncbi:sensor histidine kinase [Rhizorhapis sp. SPR117]|uniref:sensor histidine kinase n=1 Tax=Rhizorhapis sp. SPR117 TaxID=2912611 RepID=UPI001F00B29A|nr:histidine kinase [Rhizorhapis sp. SPR117]